MRGIVRLVLYRSTSCVREAQHSTASLASFSFCSDLEKERKETHFRELQRNAVIRSLLVVYRSLLSRDDSEGIHTRSRVRSFG